MKIDIIYASTSGNTEMIAEVVGKRLETLGVEIILRRAELTTIREISKSKSYIFATSTWEHGELNPYFSNLYKEMRDFDFKEIKGAFIGLGDTRYEPVFFAEGIKLLRKRFIENNGDDRGRTLFINGDPYPWIDEAEEWAGDILEEFQKIKKRLFLKL